MVLHARLSNLIYKMVREMAILTEFGIKEYFAKKNYPVVFVMPYPIYHKNMSQIEFSTLAAKLRICLIFTGRHS